MDVLDRIFSIAHKYNVELKAEDQKVELAEAKLKDGTTVVTPAEAMAVGVEVFVMNADGEQMPVPDGDYELENGAKITVEGGKITAIEEAPVEAPAETPAAAPAQVNAEKEKEKEEKEELTLESITALVEEKVKEEMRKYKKEMEDKEKDKEKDKEEKMAKMEESFMAQLPAKAKVKRTEKVNLKELKSNQRVSALFNNYYNG